MYGVAGNLLQVGHSLEWQSVRELTLGRLASVSSSCFLSPRISLMHVASLPPSLISSSSPFSQSLSFWNEGSARDVVVERRWSWSRVTEREEFVGKMSFVSRLPQYLEICVNRGWIKASQYALYAGNVDWRGGGRLVDGHGSQEERSCEAKGRKRRLK